ncbi:hypothetical protein DFAR_1260019 [Desulfarculales bacterium]
MKATKATNATIIEKVFFMITLSSCFFFNPPVVIYRHSLLHSPGINPRQSRDGLPIQEPANIRRPDALPQKLATATLNDQNTSNCQGSGQPSFARFRRQN